MAVQHAAQREGWSAGAEVPARVTPRQTFCGPLLSAMLFGGGSEGVSDIYVHIRDIVSLSARDWESNPLERRLSRVRSSPGRPPHPVAPRRSEPGGGATPSVLTRLGDQPACAS